MLDVEDVEDVSCTVDDIESTDRLGCLVQRGWGMVGQVYEGQCPRCSGEAVKTALAITALFVPGFTVTTIALVSRHCSDPTRSAEETLRYR